MKKLLIPILIIAIIGIFWYVLRAAKKIPPIEPTYTTLPRPPVTDSTVVDDEIQDWGEDPKMK